ncbi:MAG: prepilin-type N-terminal cleavage/methylation domain-containing protein [Thermodesulfovibrionales bacterium]|nr:prepilin-type N-terminal cleavage/methylation domain-containing protein [Thermodesulfovibrionales bacterium]
MGQLQPVIRNKKQNFFVTQDGVSLVEVMIALVVLLLVFMGLLQAALLGIDSNMRNILRDEAVNVAAMRMEEARSMLFDNVVDDTADTITDDTLNLAACPAGDNPYPVEVDRNFRNIQDFPFGTNRTVIDLNADTKQIQILVRWEYKNECYTHSATTLRRR